MIYLKKNLELLSKNTKLTLNINETIEYLNNLHEVINDYKNSYRAE